MTSPSEPPPRPSQRPSSRRLRALAVTPATLSFTATAGGANPAGRTLSVANTGGGTLSFTASTDAPWLSVSPGSGTAPAELTVSADIAGLAPGTYNATVTVSAAGATGSPKPDPGDADRRPAAGAGRGAVRPDVQCGRGCCGPGGAVAVRDQHRRRHVELLDVGRRVVARRDAGRRYRAGRGVGIRQSCRPVPRHVHGHRPRHGKRYRRLAPGRAGHAHRRPAGHRPRRRLGLRRARRAAGARRLRRRQPRRRSPARPARAAASAAACRSTAATTGSRSPTTGRSTSPAA